MNIDQAIVAVSDFLQPLMPEGTQIVRGQVNGPPLPPDPCIVITEIGQPQYTTTRSKMLYLTGQMSYKMPVQLRLQIDFYGDQSGDMVNVAQTILRSGYATEAFPEGIEPLYTTEAMQAPLITGEKQYEARWLIELFVQYNTEVIIGQESFNTVGSILVDPVDVTIPAE